jgi:hypothetical protein
MKRQRCGHTTKAACIDCSQCFTCCQCEKLKRKWLKQFMGIASRVQKRDEWFIGGFLGEVAEAAEEAIEASAKRARK